MIVAILLLIVLAPAIAVVIWRVWFYRRFLRYSPAQDQRYDFSESSAVIVEVHVGPEGFAWPEAAGEFDTIFLEVRIAGEGWINGGWWWNEPRLEMRRGAVTKGQYFERGAAGLRYFHLSALAKAHAETGARVDFRRFGIVIPEQTGRWIAFRTPLSERPRVLVVAPHPDDAEIAAFGLYSQSEACVATVTAGEHGGFLSRQGGDPQARLRLTARLRVWDAITIPRLGGVAPERALNLCYGDGTLSALFAAPHDTAPAAALSQSDLRALRRLNISPLVSQGEGLMTWNRLVEDLRLLIEHLQPEVIVTPHPLLDGHADHAFATIAICEALASAKSLAGQLLLHVTHTPWSTMHPIGEADGVVSLPPHFGEPVPFRALRSVTLSVETQQWKLLAIEAQHDLRTMPSLGAPRWLGAVRSFLAETRGAITGLRRDPTNFQRRAARPNELFFVVPFSEAGALAEQSLEKWRPQ